MNELTINHCQRDPLTDFEKRLFDIQITLGTIEGYLKGSTEGLLRRLEAIEASLERIELKRKK